MPLAPKVKLVPLTDGQFAIVDAEDYEKVSCIKWIARFDNKTKSYRAYNRKVGHMYRFILDVTDPKILVDHKDHNTLNNMKNNLRPCTISQNNRNRRVEKAKE